jgi:thioredoxin-related protein
MRRLPVFTIALFFFAAPVWSAPFERAADDLASEARAAAMEGKLLAVLFEQKDCDYCHVLRADVLSNDKAEVFGKIFRSIRVAIDQSDTIKPPKGESLPRSQWAEKLGVFATPAFVFFDGEGNFVYRHLGTLASPEELILLGQFIRDEAYEQLPWTVWRDAHGGVTTIRRAEEHKDPHKEHAQHQHH